MSNKFTFKSHLPDVKRAIDAGVVRNVEHAARDLHGEVLRVLRGPRSGEEYRVPGTQRTYTASAPGEPPASRLGDLRTDYAAEKQNGESWFVGSRLEYARHLELGARKANLRPRPHLSVALGNMTRRIRAALGQPIT